MLLLGSSVFVCLVCGIVGVAVRRGAIGFAYAKGRRDALKTALKVVRQRDNRLLFEDPPGNLLVRLHAVSHLKDVKEALLKVEERLERLDAEQRSRSVRRQSEG
jgi:hypothetical protein